METFFISSSVTLILFIFIFSQYVVLVISYGNPINKKRYGEINKILHKYSRLNRYDCDIITGGLDMPCISKIHPFISIFFSYHIDGIGLVRRWSSLGNDIKIKHRHLKNEYINQFFK